MNREPLCLLTSFNSQFLYDCTKDFDNPDAIIMYTLQLTIVEIAVSVEKQEPVFCFVRHPPAR